MAAQSVTFSPVGNGGTLRHATVTLTTANDQTVPFSRVGFRTVFVQARTVDVTANCEVEWRHAASTSAGALDASGSVVINQFPVNNTNSEHSARLHHGLAIQDAGGDYFNAMWVDGATAGPYLAIMLDQTDKGNVTSLVLDIFLMDPDKG